MVVSAASRRDLLRRWAAPVSRMTRAVTRPAVAWIAPDMCTAWSGSDCRVCEAVCPRPGAVRFAAGGRGPLVDHAVCDGCGLCIAACEQMGSAGAIRWVSR